MSRPECKKCSARQHNLECLSLGETGERKSKSEGSNFTLLQGSIRLRFLAKLHFSLLGRCVFQNVDFVESFETERIVEVLPVAQEA